MSTAEDFLLLMTDPLTGRSSVPSTASDPAFGGAFLFDLVAARRLALDGAGRKARVVVVDQTPVDQPVLQAAFDRVRQRGRQSPRNTVTRLGRKGAARTYDVLVASGALRRRQEKAWGLFTVTRHDVVDTARRDDLLNRVRASLLHEQPADEETGPLIGLLSATGLTKLVVDKPDRRRAKERAKVIAEGDWASEGVRQAIQAAQAAVTAGLTAAAVAGTSGS